MEIRREFSFGNLIEDTQGESAEAITIPKFNIKAQQTLSQSDIQEQRQKKLGNDTIQIDPKTGELIIVDTQSGKLASVPKKQSGNQLNKNEINKMQQDVRNSQQMLTQQLDGRYQQPPNQPPYAQHLPPYQQQVPQQPPPQRPPMQYGLYTQQYPQHHYQYPPYHQYNESPQLDQYQRPIHQQHYKQQQQQQQQQPPYQNTAQQNAQQNYAGSLEQGVFQGHPQSSTQSNFRGTQGGGFSQQFAKGYFQAIDSIKRAGETLTNQQQGQIIDSMNTVNLSDTDKQLLNSQRQNSKATSYKETLSLPDEQSLEQSQSIDQGLPSGQVQGQGLGKGIPRASQDMSRQPTGDLDSRYDNSNIQSTANSSKEDSLVNEGPKQKSANHQGQTQGQSQPQDKGLAADYGIRQPPAGPLNRNNLLQSRDNSNKQIYSNQSSLISESDSEQVPQHSRQNSYNSLSNYQQQQQLPPQYHTQQGPMNYEGRDFEGASPGLRLRVNPHLQGRSTPFGESPRQHQPPYSPSLRTQPPPGYLNSNQSYFQNRTPSYSYGQPIESYHSGLQTARSQQYNTAFAQISNDYDRYQNGRTSSMSRKPPNFYRHQLGDSDSALSSRGEFLKTYKLQDKEKHYQSQTEKHMDQQMSFIKQQHGRIKELQEKYHGAVTDVQTMMGIINTIAKVMQQRDDQSELIQQEFQEVTDLARKWEKSNKIKRSSTKTEIGKMLPQVRKNVEMFRSKRDGELQQKISEEIDIAKQITKSYTNKMSKHENLSQNNRPNN